MELIFVYNAHTDPVSATVDYLHKVFSPKTYKCELCALTHHNLGQRSAWTQFKKESGAEMQFMYIKGFEKKFGGNYTYPVVLEIKSDGLHQALNKNELADLNNVEGLIVAIKNYIHNNES
ncbi:MAG: GTPase [Crocinitomicaceae bacterium]|nr:GTPase [Crocinitomicaceae bacterium]